MSKDKDFKLTYEKVNRLFKYDQSTGFLFWRINFSKKIRAGCKAGYLNSCGHLRLKLYGKQFYIHRIIWLMNYGYLPENFIDHIDKDKTNNKLNNLREVSFQCNLRNKGNQNNNTSGVKGVTWHERDKRWRVAIGLNNKKYKLGSFKDFDEAVCFRLAVEQCLNWSGCNSTSPAYLYVKQLQRKTPA